MGKKKKDKKLFLSNCNKMATFSQLLNRCLNDYTDLTLNIGISKKIGLNCIFPKTFLKKYSRNFAET